MTSTTITEDKPMMALAEQAYTETKEDFIQ